MKTRVIGAVAALVVAAAVALTGCAAPKAETKPNTAAPTESQGPVSIPTDTVVGQRMTWLLALLEQPQDVTEADVAEKFSESFTSQVPVAEVVTLLNGQIRPAAPFVVTAYEGNDTSAQANVAPNIGQNFKISLAVDSAGVIESLFFGPAEKPWTASKSLAEVEKRLKKLPVTVSAQVVTRDANGGSKTPLSISPSETRPLGSTFKLYVLLALSRAVTAGELSWDDMLTVTDAAKSLPSGTLQDSPEGTQLTVREAATAMISISDNTATDLLITRLGQERLAAAVSAAGHKNPKLLTPLATTRDFFLLGWGADAKQLRAKWKDGDSAARSAILADLAGLPLAVNPTAITTPVWQYGVDWFASAQDIVALHDALAATGDAELRKILSANSGLGSLVDAKQWPYVAFKGGSAPGVLAGSWRAERADGSSVTVVIQLSAADPAAISGAESAFVNLAADTLRLLG